MHLMIAIALGVFGGLWLFVKWGEWREARWVRKIERQQRKAARQAELERQYAALGAEQAMTSPTPPLNGPFVGFAVLSAAVLLLVILSL